MDWLGRLPRFASMRVAIHKSQQTIVTILERDTWGAAANDCAAVLDDF